MPSADDPHVTAGDLTARLDVLRRDAGPAGPPMRTLFALARDFIDLPVAEIEALLDEDRHDTRVTAVSVMDWQARRRRTGEQHRRELYELYRRRHDRINTWDLVDRAAPHVVGGYLASRERDPLYELARSPRWFERRTAIVATWFFLRQNEVDDTFALAHILADDPVELVQKAVGGWLREAGKRDLPRLHAFLEEHAATLPRPALRYAVEHLDSGWRRHYMALRASTTDSSARRT